MSGKCAGPILCRKWMDAILLQAGDRVLEVGAGPGYLTLLLADRVGPTGSFNAVDRSADALAYLEHRQNERKITQIRRIAADAATLEADLQADCALRHNGPASRGRCGRTAAQHTSPAPPACFRHRCRISSRGSVRVWRTPGISTRAGTSPKMVRGCGLSYRGTIDARLRRVTWLLGSEPRNHCRTARFSLREILVGLTNPARLAGYRSATQLYKTGSPALFSGWI